jgi:hypothetical protein
MLALRRWHFANTFQVRPPGKKASQQACRLAACRETGNSRDGFISTST